MPTVFSASSDVGLSGGQRFAVEGGWVEAPTPLVQSHSLTAMTLELPMEGSVVMGSFGGLVSACARFGSFRAGGVTVGVLRIHFQTHRHFHLRTRTRNEEPVFGHVGIRGFRLLLLPRLSC